MDGEPALETALSPHSMGLRPQTPSLASGAPCSQLQKPWLILETFAEQCCSVVAQSKKSVGEPVGAAL